MHHIFPYDPSHLGLSVEDWWRTQLQRWPLSAVAEADFAKVSTVHIIGRRSRVLVSEKLSLVVNGSRWSGPRFRPWGHDWSRSLERALRSLSNDDLAVIHLLDYPATELAVAALRNVPYVLVAHGDHNTDWTNYSGTAGFVGLREDRLPLLAESGADPSRLFLATPSVDVTIFRPPNPQKATPGPARIGYCGRLSYAKGMDTVEETVRVLLASKLAFTLTCIGSDMEGYVPRLGQSMPAGAITFLGELQPCEVASHMRTWDLMIAPSRTEGFGIAVLEALSCHVPVVAVAGVLPPRLSAHPLVHLAASREDLPTLVEELVRAGIPAISHPCTSGRLLVRGPQLAGREWDSLILRTTPCHSARRVHSTHVHLRRVIRFRPFIRLTRPLRRLLRRAGTWRYRLTRFVAPSHAQSE